MAMNETESVSTENTSRIMNIFQFILIVEIHIQSKHITIHEEILTDK